MDKKIILQIRAFKKWTQADLAKELGVSRACVAQWEGRKLPLSRIHELAFRQLVGDEDYYIAAQRAERGTEPTGNKFRGFM